MSALPPSKPGRGGNGAPRWAAALPVALFGLALALRIFRLGTVFDSSDNTELAARILLLPGYGWMLQEQYGVLINLLVKIPVGLLSMAGVTITEFWWRAPIALAGAAQVFVTWGLLRRLGCGRRGQLAGAALMVVLPIHVMQSRYLWGYEALGFLCLTGALWALVAWLQGPSLRRGLVASAALGLYLISHGYLIPVLPCLFAAVWLFGGQEGSPRRWAFWRAWAERMGRHGLWGGPLLALPMAWSPLAHALSKDSQPGFYVLDHLPGLVWNVGLFVVGALVAAVWGAWRRRDLRSPGAGLMALCGAAYLAPLFFGAPPGVTVVRGYMLIGCGLWALAAALVFDRVRAAPLAAGATAAVVLAGTLWGTVASIHGRDEWPNPAWTRVERGGVPADPGVKTAGWLARRHIPESAAILAIHRSIETPNFYYYFGRLQYAYFDLSLERSILGFPEHAPGVDVVICDSEQRAVVEADGGFRLMTTVYSEGLARLWIYGRPGVVDIPIPTAQVEEYNGRFDREYAWPVRLW